MQKINFVNLPSTTTPINATNLNLMQTYIDEGKISQLVNISSKDLNTYTDTGIYYCNNCTNTPGMNGYLCNIKATASYCTQTYYPYGNTDIYTRRLNNGTWTSWRNVPSIVEGTWTPTLNTQEGVAPTYTTTAVRGRFRKMGDLVFIEFYMRGNITALNGTNNFAIIKGLPYAPGGSLGQEAISTGICYNCVTTTEVVSLSAYNNSLRLQSSRGAAACIWKVTPSGQHFDLGGSGWFILEP